MKIHIFLPVALFLLASQWRQDTTPVAIISPRAGDVLLGEVSIMGTTDISGFVSARLEFKYASDQADTWFLLQTLPQPAHDTPLFLWDTTTITDGDYILRLRVTLLDGTFQDAAVPVVIQNDRPLPTLTPAFTSTPEVSFQFQAPTPFLLAASPTPTEVPRPTPTSLPANPASLDQNTIFASLGRGALVISGFYLFAGILLRFRRS